MTLLYKAQQSTLESKDGTKKWHPRLVKIGRAVTVAEMSEEISKRSSLSPGDVLSVIYHLTDVIRGNLLSSRSVKLDGLGNFTAIIRSGGQGFDCEDDVCVSSDCELKVRFTPAYKHDPINGSSRVLYSNVQFERYDRKKCSSKSFKTVEGGMIE